MNPIDVLHTSSANELMPHERVMTVRVNNWPMLVTHLTVTQTHHWYASLQRTKDERTIWFPGFKVPNGLYTQTPHRHDFFELVYVKSGELTHRLEQSVFHYQTGDAILLNQGIQHIESLDSPCEVVFIGMYPNYLKQLLHENPVMPEEIQYMHSGIPDFLTQSNTEHFREYLDFVYTFE